MGTEMFQGWNDILSGKTGRISGQTATLFEVTRKIKQKNFFGK